MVPETLKPFRATFPPPNPPTSPPNLPSPQHLGQGPPEGRPNTKSPYRKLLGNPLSNLFNPNPLVRPFWGNFQIPRTKLFNPTQPPNQPPTNVGTGPNPFFSRTPEETRLGPARGWTGQKRGGNRSPLGGGPPPPKFWRPKGGRTPFGPGTNPGPGGPQGNGMTNKTVRRPTNGPHLVCCYLPPWRPLSRHQPPIKHSSRSCTSA